jgi:hypothetical protein
MRLGLLPVAITWMIEKNICPRLAMCTVDLARSSGDGLNRRAHRRGHSDSIWIVASTAFDPVPRWKKCIETLNEGGVASEKLGDAVNHARRVDSSCGKCQSLRSGEGE